MASDEPAGTRILGSLRIAFYGTGWQIHAEELAAYLAGRERGDAGARWAELVPLYQDLAASIG